MGTNYYLVKKKPTLDRALHIGKASAGWRFLFYKPAIYEVDRPLNTFEQWRDYLKEATESHEYVILNEYEREVEYDELLEIIAKKQSENRPDMFDHWENVNGYMFASCDFS